MQYRTRKLLLYNPQRARLPSLARKVLSDPAFQEILQRILSFVVELDPDGAHIMDYGYLDAREDMYQDDDIFDALTSRDTLSYRLVNSLWNEEINRISDRYEIAHLDPEDIQDIADFPRPRLRRLHLCAPLFNAAQLEDIRLLLDNSPSLVRLHARIYPAQPNDVPTYIEELGDFVHRLIHRSAIRIFRWNGPPVDVLSTISGSDVVALTLDRLPTHTLCSKTPLSLDNLIYLCITLASKAPFVGEVPDIFKVLIIASLKRLCHLGVTSVAAFPFFDQFLVKVAPNLLTLRVRESKHNPVTLLHPFPLLPNVYECSVQLFSAQQLLRNQLPRLAVLELYAFDRMSMRDRILRRENLLTLFELSKYIRFNESTLFPSLRTIRLIGMDEEYFRFTFWYILEEGIFGYCYRALYRVGIELIGEDGYHLLPYGQTNRLTKDMHSYGDQFDPFI